jgi:hypothetical protein
MNAPTGSTPTIGGDILVVATDNAWVHVYTDVPSLLADDRVLGAGSETVLGDCAAGVEFYDADGRRYAPVFDSWKLTDLRPVPDRPDPARVAARLCTVMWRISRQIVLHPDEIPQGRDPMVALAALPDLDGKDLKQCIAELRAAHFGDRPTILRTPGDWLHVLFCH